MTLLAEAIAGTGWYMDRPMSAAGARAVIRRHDPDLGERLDRLAPVRPCSHRYGPVVVLSSEDEWCVCGEPWQEVGTS